MRRGLMDHAAFGDAILARFVSTAAPAALRAPLTAFKTTHNAYLKAIANAQIAKGARDDAMARVGDADDALDAALGHLADALVGEGLGQRKNPFKSFGAHGPSQLTGLAYAVEAAESLKLCAAIKKKAPRAGKLNALLTTVTGKATAVKTALAGLTTPQNNCAKALAARDALLLPWTQALGRLKRHSALAWEDEPGTHKAMFAPVPSVQVGGARRRVRKGKAAPPNGTQDAPEPLPPQ